MLQPADSPNQHKAGLEVAGKQEHKICLGSGTQTEDQTDQADCKGQGATSPVCGGGVLEKRDTRWQGTGLRPADPHCLQRRSPGKNPSQAPHRLIGRTRYCAGSPDRTPSP